MPLNIEAKSPVALQTPDIDNLWNTLLHDAVGDFRHKHLDRPLWMRQLSQEQIRQLFERFECLLARRQLRVHRDYVRCTDCWTVVEDLSIEARKILKGEGEEIAARIKSKATAVQESDD